MTGIIILGLENEQDLWIADLNAGTITKTATAPTGKLKVIDDMRKAGATITQGINLAVTAKTATEGSSGLREVSGGILDVSGGILDVSSGILDGLKTASVQLCMAGANIQWEAIVSLKNNARKLGLKSVPSYFKPLQEE